MARTSDRLVAALSERLTTTTDRAIRTVVKHRGPAIAASGDALRAEFPAYTFAIAQTWYGASLVASRTGAGDGPLVVITADVDELRETLTPQARTR